MKLHIYDTEAETIKALAGFFISTVNASLQKNGNCSVVLAGGNSPKQLYLLLASNEYKNKIDWSNVSFFFGDERCVPFYHPDNNGLMAKQTLLEPLKIDESKIFYINSSLSPEQAAANYTDAIFTYFGERIPQFDLVLLGLGDNAHTASLFPYTPVLQENKAIVRPVVVSNQNSNRITMTAALLNEAKHIAFLVYGAQKATAVYHVIKDEKDTAQFPAQLIQPLNGTVNWFLDAAAATLV